uniref:LRRCT domain-containing protein n=1 Tax=Ornithorhynchus anatinus TaxID=9258 RepID=A0A6I8NDU0_ORNAN
MDRDQHNDNGRTVRKVTDYGRDGRFWRKYIGNDSTALDNNKNGALPREGGQYSAPLITRYGPDGRSLFRQVPEASGAYTCEARGLRAVPDSLPASAAALDFSFNILPTLWRHMFGRLTSLEHLDLSRCQVNWVHEDAFEPNVRLGSLVLTGNPLIFLAERAFAGPRLLTRLGLAQTGITDLSFVPLARLRGLETLLLGGNAISSLRLPPAFPARSLRTLDLGANAVRHVAAGDLSGLAAAANLSLLLQANPLASAEPGAFNVTAFDGLNLGGVGDLGPLLAGLRGTAARTLWLGVFEDAPVGPPPPLTPAALRGLCDVAVDTLSLQGRRLPEPLPANASRCLARLKGLDLSHTHLKALPAGLGPLPALRELALGRNAFRHLADPGWTGFPALAGLAVRGNELPLELGPGCLAPLTGLERLDLSRSQIDAPACCHPQLQGLGGLRQLALGHNRRLELVDGAFRDCPQLERLDLAGTPLGLAAAAPPGPFHGLNLLRDLNLSRCGLDPGHPDLLAGLAGLRRLDLSGNPFPADGGALAGLLGSTTTLEELALADCGLEALPGPALATLTALRRLDLSGNRLTSADGLRALRGLSLDLEANQLRLVPPGLLTALAAQSDVRLARNPLDCSCSNVRFLAWFRETPGKTRARGETTCGGPPALEGVPVADVVPACGLSAGGVALLVLLVLTGAGAGVLCARHLAVSRTQGRTPLSRTVRGAGWSCGKSTGPNAKRPGF